MRELQNGRLGYWLVLGAILAQGSLVLGSDVPHEHETLPWIFLLVLCVGTHFGWLRRFQFPGLDRVIVPLAFGGLGVVLGQLLVRALSSNHGASVTTAHGLGSRLLVMAAMLLVCLPACALLCSHADCRGGRTGVLVELTVLHAIMMLGMLTSSWIVVLLHTTGPTPMSSYVGGVLGMALGATVAVFLLRWRARRLTRSGC